VGEHDPGLPAGSSLQASCCSQAQGSALSMRRSRGQGSTTASASSTGLRSSSSWRLGARRSRSARKASLCQTLPGAPWSWLPGITSTGSSSLPMAAQTALTSLRAGVGESNRSPATTRKEAPAAVAPIRSIASSRTWRSRERLSGSVTRA